MSPADPRPVAGRRARRTSAVALATAALAAVALAGAGCADIPDSGSVHSGRTLGQPGAPAVSLFLNRPTSGESPAAIVHGFLSALASPGDIGVARAYLTPTAQHRWRPGPSVTVYDDRTAALRSHGRGRWVLQTRQLALIGPSGHWTVARQRMSLPFRLVRTDGQWRIAVPPDRLVLAAVDLGLSYDEYQLTFLGAATGRQVDIPAVLPDEQPGLATALVHALLAGPPRDVAGAVTTAAPPGAAVIGNVTVTRGVADVNLTSPVRGLTGARLRTFAQQVLLTLQQVPGVREVRVLADRVPIATSGSADPLRTTNPPPKGLLLTRSGVTVEEVTSAGGGTQRPSAAPAHRLLGAHWPKVTAALLRGDGVAVAAATGGRHQRLLVGPPDGTPAVVAHAAEIRLLQASGGTALVTVDGHLAAVTDYRLQPIRVPRWLTVGGVLSAALAPDGVRIAVLAGPPGDARLFVGALTPDHRLVGLHPVMPLEDPVGVEWSAPDALATTALEGGRRVIVVVDPAGFAEHRSALPARLRSVDALCAAPSVPVVVVGDGLAWSRQGGQWARLGPATSCAYPG